MATDIYGKKIDTLANELARSENYVLQTGRGKIALAQNVNYNYNQQLQRVYELGSSDIIMASGRTGGTLQIGRVIGIDSENKKTLRGILGKKFYHVDGTSGGELTLIPKSRSDTPMVKNMIYGAFVTSESGGVDANGVTVIQNVSIEFNVFTTDEKDA